MDSQWQILKRDKWLLSCLTLIPLLLALSLWWIFSQSFARELPFAVVDLEHSNLSRQLTRTIEATPSLSVDSQFTSAKEAEQALVEGSIYGYAVIPRNYTRDLLQNNPPQVSVFYNSQYILIGKVINSALLQAHGTFNAQVEVVKQLSKGGTPITSAAAKSLTVRNQIVSLFNSNSSYEQFLVGAIIPALWQIIIIVTTILALTANHRYFGLQSMLNGSPVLALMRLLSFYFPFYALMGIGFIFWFYFGLDWPQSGSLMTIIITQWLMIIACMIMGAFFYFLVLDPARAMSFAGAFTAPSFAFMGVTFPVTDMSNLAQFWRSLLPASHYIEAQIAQSSYGVTYWEALYQTGLGMIGYALPLLLLIPLCKKQLAKQPEAV